MASIGVISCTLVANNVPQLPVPCAKDSYRHGRNTPTLIFENLKPVEVSKNHLNIIWTSKVVAQILSLPHYFLISLLVSDFQRSVQECSVHICSCRWLSAVCWMNEIIMTHHIFPVLWNWCGHYTDFRIEFTHLPNGVEGKNRDSFSFSP